MNLIGKTIAEQISEIDIDIHKIGDIETTIFSHSEMQNILTGEWSNWYCTDLHKLFHTYLDYAVYDFQRAYDTITSEYNPIENYNKVSEITESAKRGDVVNSTALNSMSTTDNTGLTTNYATSFESSAEKETGQTDGTSNSTTTTSGGDTATTSYSDTTYNGITASEINKTTERTTGNIGVMSTQDMIKQELEIRLNNIKYDFIKRFVGRYCYFVGGGCDWR